MSKTKLTFTADRIPNLHCEPNKNQTIYRDIRTPSLGLRVTSTGERSYIFESKLHMKTIRITIGGPQTWTLLEAQKRARELKAIVDRGEDPREAVKENAIKIKREGEAFVPAIYAWDEYIEERKSHWGEWHYHTHVRMAEDGSRLKKFRAANRAKKPNVEPGILYSFMKMPLSQITREVVQEWMKREVTKRPVHTRQGLTLLTTFLNWCADHKSYGLQVRHGLLTGLKKKLPKPGKRRDCLRKAQIKPFFDAVVNLENPVVRVYLQALLITGARSTEMATLKWSDVSLRWNQMTIRDKVEGEREIPLTPYLKSLIEELPRVNEYVFGNPNNKFGRIKSVRKSLNNVCQVADIPHLTPHGLRRSFITLAEWAECPKGVISQIAGHKPTSTSEAHYTIREMDFLMIWHNKIEKFFIDQAEIIY